MIMDPGGKCFDLGTNLPPYRIDLRNQTIALCNRDVGQP